MLAYLWHRDQRELMSEMISSGVDAILIKVAAMGKHYHIFIYLITFIAIIKIFILY